VQPGSRASRLRSPYRAMPVTTNSTLSFAKLQSDHQAGNRLHRLFLRNDRTQKKKGGMLRPLSIKQVEPPNDTGGPQQQATRKLRRAS
jgi:hypothetical protein